MSLMSIKNVYSQDQSYCCGLNNDSLQYIFSFLSFEDALGLWPSCKKMYGIYMQYIGEHNEYHSSFLHYFVNRKQPEQLEEALTHFSQVARPLKLELDLLSPLRLKEIFQIAAQKFSIPCIILLPDQSVYNKDYERRLHATLPEAGKKSIFQRVKSLFVTAVFDKEAVLEEKARLFSEALPMLGPALRRIEVCPCLREAFAQKVFIRASLPNTLKQVRMAYQLKDQKDRCTVFSTSQLEEIEFADQIRMKYLSDIQHFAFPESLSSFSVHGYHDTVEDCRRLFDKLFFQCPKLEKMEFSGVIHSLGVHLRLPPNLKSVTLKPRGVFDSTDIRRTFFRALLRNSPELEFLTLEKSALRDKKVCELLSSFKNLKHLCFDGSLERHVELSAEEIKALKKVIKNLHTLTIKRVDSP